MQKKPTLELPQHVHRVVVKGREYFYFQRGRGTASAGPSVKLPGGPHTVEFWAAYKTQLNGDVSTGRSFNDLILAYRVSPEFDKRAASTKRDYLRYLEIISKGVGRAAGQRPQTEARHRSARQMGKHAGRREPSYCGAEDAGQLGHPARVL